jgi:hypothetical protein
MEDAFSFSRALSSHIVARAMLASCSAMAVEHDASIPLNHGCQARLCYRNNDAQFRPTAQQSGWSSLPGAVEQHQAIIGPHRIELQLFPPGCAVPHTIRSRSRTARRGAPRTTGPYRPDQRSRPGVCSPGPDAPTLARPWWHQGPPPQYRALPVRFDAHPSLDA